MRAWRYCGTVTSAHVPTYARGDDCLSLLAGIGVGSFLMEGSSSRNRVAHGNDPIRFCICFWAVQNQTGHPEKRFQVTSQDQSGVCIAAMIIPRDI